MNLLFYFQILVFYLFNFHLTTVLGIDCFQCVSSNRTDGIGCRQPDQSNTPYKRDCKMSGLAGQQSESFACVKTVERIEDPSRVGVLNLVQEQIIRDCISVPMKAGCEKRELSNYKLNNNKKPALTKTQCIYICQEDGCNRSGPSPQLSSLISLISVIVLCLVF